jgi:hypothetical protein
MSDDEEDCSSEVSVEKINNSMDPVHDINKLVESQLVPVKDLSEYWTVSGIITLTLAPFVQGLFYGLGEGIARVFVGEWIGLEPYYALGGRLEPSKAKELKRKSVSEWLFPTKPVIN